MNRSERLFELLDILKATSFLTAAEAAKTLDVSQRTIYRDIRTLIRNGCPIRGEAGVGYRLEQPTTDRPLKLERTEIEALLVGMRWLESWADAELLKATQQLIRKLQLEASQSTTIFITPNTLARTRTFIGHIRQCILYGSVIDVHYTDATGQSTQRSITPLGLFYWQSHWTVAAYCELREDYRSFRLDRIKSMTPQKNHQSRAGISLAEYLQRAALNAPEATVSEA